MSSQVLVKFSNLKGSVKLPYSKSVLIRALICSYLSNSYEKFLVHSKWSDEELPEDVINAAHSLSIKGLYKLMGFGADSMMTPTLLAGESAALLRFLTAVSLALGETTIIQKSGTLPRRDSTELFEVLSQHGAIIKDNPSELICSSRIEPGTYFLTDISSSQTVSALLLALPLLKADSEIFIKGEIPSKPYIDLTRAILKEFSVTSFEIAKDNLIQYHIPGSQEFREPSDIEEFFETDWSAASMFLVLRELVSEILPDSYIKVPDLNYESLQPDARIIEILDELRRACSDEIEIDILETPDLLPAVCLLALGKSAKLRITSIKNLQNKESKRASLIVEIINKAGYEARLTNDEIFVDGSSRAVGAGPLDIETPDDHRLVMFASCLALFHQDGVWIHNPEAVAKSFPMWFRELENLGARIE